MYLGDLGRDLPSDEWGHWLTYNLLPEGQMEEGRFRRDFLAQFVSSPDIPTDLRRARAEASVATERLFANSVWRPLAEDIAPEYESMIGPLRNPSRPPRSADPPGEVLRRWHRPGPAEELPRRCPEG